MNNIINHKIGMIKMWDELSDEISRHVIAKNAVNVPSSKNCMVAAKHPLAALAGIKILKKGGNAVDAAIATHFALAVVEPFMTGIGGGGRCVIRMENGETFAMNFEPMTPGKENPFEPDPEREASIYKVSLGRPAAKNDSDIFGYKAAAVPGFIKGMSILAEKYGTLDFGDLLEPATKYAEEGVLLTTYIAKAIAFDAEIISKFPETANILLKDGFPPKPWGAARWSKHFDKLVQKDLANTLKKIAKDGPEIFYKGEIAQSIAEDMEKNDGYINEKDLSHYKPEILKPSLGEYRGHQLISLPVSTNIFQILHILDNFKMGTFEPNSVEAIHLLTEAIKLTFSARKKFLGYGQKELPYKGIISKDYAKLLSNQISLKKALIQPDLGDPWAYEDETTHACVIDKDRNVAGIHSSLGETFGCKVTIKGTGIILNNKMKDYDPRPGQPDSVIPHKIKPPPSGSTIIMKNENPFMVIGSPGGNKQICAVARSISNVIDFGMSIQDAIDAPRAFVQSGRVFLDSKIPANVPETLSKMGHDIIRVDKEFGFATPNGILVDPETGLLYGGVDRDLPHGLDGTTLGY
jgi:gamma-glutamyltranspeptidase/glutathione hydrolase